MLSGGRVTQHRGHPCAPGRTRVLSPSAPAPRASRACPRPASAVPFWATRRPMAWRVLALPGAPSSTWDLPTLAGAYPPDGSRSSDPGLAPCLLLDSLATPETSRAKDVRCILFRKQSVAHQSPQQNLPRVLASGAELTD